MRDTPVGSLKSLFLYPIRMNAEKHGLGSRYLAKAAWWYLEHYNNVNVDMVTNGELAALTGLKRFQPRVVLDVGANVGDWSSAAAGILDGAEVHAFEPSPRLHTALRIRGEHEGFHVHALALSDFTGQAPLRIAEAQSEFSTLVVDALDQFSGRSSVVDVEVMTLQKWMTDTCTPAVDILKLDVEGHELAVLKGAAALLENIRFIQFEHNTSVSQYSRVWLRDFYTLLSDRFEIGRITPQGCLFQPYSPTLERYHYGNYLCVPRADEKALKALSRF